MPKRHGNLFETMFTPDALYKAYLSSRKRKRKKSAVYKFEKDLGANLSRLHQELQDGSYNPRPYKTFYVHDPKPRLIFAPHFRDVVVQHAMYSVLYPIMDKTFCFESFGCGMGKGRVGRQIAPRIIYVSRQKVAIFYNLTCVNISTGLIEIFDSHCGRKR